MPVKRQSVILQLQQPINLKVQLKLTLKKYLVYALSLPLIIPAMLWGLVQILPSNSFLLQNSTLGDIGVALLMSLIIGGVPYIIFLIITFILYRNKPGNNLLEYCYFSPLIFYVIIMLCVVFYRLYEITFGGLDINGWIIQNFIGTAIIYGIFTFLIGYTYVGVTVLMLFTLRKFDIVNSK